MKKMNKAAITIVELIVVITILAILGTISMLAFQWYTVNARDSVRVKDLNTIKTAIEYARIEQWQYITPDNGIDITYSWSVVVRNQGVFWNAAKRKTKRLDKVPVDPLTEDEYTFSVTANGWEFELGAIMEWDDIVYEWPSILNSTYAATSYRAYINWTYNGKIAKASSWWLDYIFALPSIISTDLWTPTISYITTNNLLVKKWYENLPSSYNNTDNGSSTPLERDFVNDNKVVVFEWNFDDLKDNETEQVLFLSNLQEAYQGTVIEDSSEIKEILDVNTVDNTEWTQFLAQSLIKNTIDKKFEITASNTVSWWWLSWPVPMLLCNNFDYSSAMNTRNGFNNDLIYPSDNAFAALKSDWSITAWWRVGFWWDWAPIDNWYVSIASSLYAFAALKWDGSITTWWRSSYWWTWGPIDSGYVSIASTSWSFAALKSDGSITAWGWSWWSGEPIDNGYLSIASTWTAFAALKPDGSITAWGWNWWTWAPTDNWYVSITSTNSAFAALKPDGSITAWGYWTGWWTWAPTDNGYTSIISGTHVFAALKWDGSITAWWNSTYWWIWAPTDNGYVSITSTWTAFAALKNDSSIVVWWHSTNWWSWFPTDNGYVSIASSWSAFAALKWDGSITAWGLYWWSGEPTDNWYVSITSSRLAFAALKLDGSVTAWGYSSGWWGGEPTDSGYVSIASWSHAFAALKPDGSITAWGDANLGWSGEPTDSGYIAINGVCLP